MPFNHDALIQLMKAFNYPIDENGMCNGFAIMGMQAFLANDLSSFEKRINIINSLLESKKIGRDINLLIKNIETIENKRLIILKKYKDELKHQLEIKSENDSLFNILLQEKKDDPRVKKYYQKIYAINQDLLFTNEEQNLLDVRVFLEGVTLYQRFYKFQEIFEKKSKRVAIFAIRPLERPCLGLAKT
jgi:hypothetical protein